MGVLAPDSIQAVADALNIPVEDGVAQPLADDVEYRLREIIAEAVKFMRHSKRRKLKTDDINNALKVKGCEPLYGFAAGSGPVRFKGVQSHRLFYMQDRELDLEDVINGALPEVPLEATFTAHWLAIEGVQPAIIQNPTVTDVGVRPTLTGGPKDAPRKQTNVLSKELQLFYDKLVEAIMSEEDNVQRIAFETLEKDPGVQPILPYLMIYVTEKVAKNLKDLRVLWAMLFVLNALIRNQTIFIEPYLHQMMPSIVTCIVGRKFPANPSDDHWSLREYASTLAALLCAKYGKTYPTLKPRLSKTLLSAFLDPKKPLVTHYGAIVGLRALGKETCRVCVIANLGIFSNAVLEPALKSVDEVTRSEAHRVRDVLKSILVADAATKEQVRESLASKPREQVVEDVKASFGILGTALLK